MLLWNNGYENGTDGEFASLADAQADRISHVYATAFTARERATSGVAAAEMASWGIKVLEAKDYTLYQDDTRTPLIAMEASFRQVTVAQLAERIVNNSNNLSMLEAAIAGNSGRHVDAINALSSIENVVAYDWRDGWPVPL